MPLFHSLVVLVMGSGGGGGGGGGERVKEGWEGERFKQRVGGGKRIGREECSYEGRTRVCPGVVRERERVKG